MSMLGSEQLCIPAARGRQLVGSFTAVTMLVLLMLSQHAVVLKA